MWTIVYLLLAVVSVVSGLIGWSVYRKHKTRAERDRIKAEAPPRNEGDVSATRHESKHIPSRGTLSRREHAPADANHIDPATEQITAQIAWDKWNKLTNEANCQFFLAFSSIYLRNRSDTPIEYAELDVGIMPEELVKLHSYICNMDREELVNKLGKGWSLHFRPEFEVYSPFVEDSAEVALSHDGTGMILRAHAFYKDGATYPRTTPPPDYLEDRDYVTTAGIIIPGNIISSGYRDVTAAGHRVKEPNAIQKLSKTLGMDIIPILIDGSLCGEDPDFSDLL